DEQQTRPLIEKILDQNFERHYAGNTAPDAAVQRLVRVQGRGSDETIRALVLKLHRYAQSLAAPARWIEDQRALFAESEPKQWREWFVEHFPGWRVLWLPVLEPFADNTAVALSMAALERGSTAGFPEIAGALQAIRAADADEKNWPRGSKKNVRAPIERFFDETEFLASLTPREDADPLKEDWELVRHDMLALLELTREFSAEFSRVKREMGGVDFSDLEQFALRVLWQAETGALTDAAWQWQRRLEHVFVDEYQDINAAQDAILSALSRAGEMANRFLVGDVKQSIYRFRLADPTIFRRYEKLWSSDGRGQVISLAENFRSRQGILEFINPLFQSLMRDEVGGVAYEALNFGNPEDRSDLARRETESPRVELHLIAKAEPENAEATGDNSEPTEVADLLVTEREARLVGLRLRKLKEEYHEIWDKTEKRFRPVQWGDMAVLLRSPASRVEAFAKEFTNLGIPLEAARGGFLDSPEISDLVSLLKLIDNPLQDVPLLAVLHSPLVGMSLVELAEVRANEPLEKRSKFFWAGARQFLVDKRKAETNSSRSAGEKLNRFFVQLDRWRELVRQSSLSHCLETALVETHYEIVLRAKPRGEQQLANVRRLLDLAREYDPYQRQGLFRFLRFIRAQEETPMELEPANAGRDAVQLTSIHRSKGLEFPVVALAGLGWQFNFRDLHESILLDEQFGLCAKVAPPESDQRYPSLPHWLARRRQQRELLGEELRLLYVAMTRARDTLVLTATSARKGAGQWAGEEARAFSDQEILAARSYFDWLKLWLPQVTRAEDWIDDRAGKAKLLRWDIYEENDPRLALPVEKSRETAEGGNIQHSTFNLEPPGSGRETALGVGSSMLNVECSPGPAVTNLVSIEIPVAEMRDRIAWKYPFEAATRQPAKTSITELRRGLEAEESEVAPFARNKGFPLPNRTRKKLSAAEMGLAHHRFLQRVSLASAGNVAALRVEAGRLQGSGWLSAEEVAALDFKSLAGFWETELGRSIVVNASAVQREMPFTAGLKPADLAVLKLEPPVGLAAEEVIVVQGVVDLAVILEREIWIVDFKTDAVTELELALKVKTYEPQLKLYALALGRTYDRPVTRCALYFLGTGSIAWV
ncbi:MAG: UvrD-helicase domain-containing protein, partial [Akkermansiaceae bacterium]|nr:UvrD-helicase domain-containing protein [Verrucomicrobiales bacterium]